jgi:hypothetical protein
MSSGSHDESLLRNKDREETEVPTMLPSQDMVILKKVLIEVVRIEQSA